jgi:tyrosyl-tRNA synthetase
MAKDLLRELKERGFLHQCTDEFGLSKRLEKTPKNLAYIGFDCTAASLHVGSLMQIMLMRILQRHDITPIAILGSTTTKIGDPTGKDEARKFLSEQEIQQNFLGIKKSLSKFINFGNALMLDNSSWLEKLNYIKFLRDYGKHFSVNRILAFDSVKLRLEREQHLSFLEFNYMLLQAYDFLYLYENHNVILQCGGSDQWGNIVSGIELIRKIHQVEAFGITTPLITLASGAKMGKSEQGAVWINEDLLSPYNYYQFWRNIDDRDLFKFMRLFTDLPVDQIAGYEADKSTNINDFKKLLAFEATKMCHGEEEATRASIIAIEAFENKNLENMESMGIAQSDIDKGVAIYELFRMSGLCPSNSEARRLIRSGGARLNQEKIDDENLIITHKHFIDNALVLSSGKKNHRKMVVKS